MIVGVECQCTYLMYEYLRVRTPVRMKHQRQTCKKKSIVFGFVEEEEDDDDDDEDDRSMMMPMKMQCRTLLAVVFNVFVVLWGLSPSACCRCYAEAGGEINNKSSLLAIGDILKKIATWQRTFFEEEEGRPKLQQQQQQQQSSSLSRPFVTLSYAQTLDGKMAGVVSQTVTESSSSPATTKAASITSTTTSNLAISGPESLQLTHALRSVHDGILVGGRTLSVDNPRLNNRLWPHYFAAPPREREQDEHKQQLQEQEQDQHSSCSHQQPRAIVLDTNLQHVRQLGEARRCCNNNNDDNDRSNNSSNNRDQHYYYSPLPMIVCCSEAAAKAVRRQSPLPRYLENVQLLPCRTVAKAAATTLNNDQLDLVDCLHKLKTVCGIRSLMVEGGAHVLRSFANGYNNNNNNNSLVDCIVLTIAPKFLAKEGIAPNFESLPSMPANHDDNNSNSKKKY